MNNINQAKKQAGFTLVELAIVLIIVGLLIGGILKGQELIGNARVAATVSQAKAIDAALSTFYEAYDGVPGDIAAPATRLQGCIGTCNRAGDTNGRIGTEPGAAQAVATENITAWSQLAASDILGSIQIDGGATVVPGVAIPAAEIPGSSFQVGFTAGTLTAATNAAVAAAGGTARAGHYLSIDNSREAVAAAGVASLLPTQAARIDAKLDDGLPNTGSVLAMGAVGATNCAQGGDTTAANNLYREANQQPLCGVYVRVQG
jgi:prepilin-type N-terminal cleavage/methylation domain-containing protein